MRRIFWIIGFVVLVAVVLFVLFIWPVPGWLQNARTTASLLVPKETVVVRQTVVVRETVERLITAIPPASTATKQPTMSVTATATVSPASTSVPTGTSTSSVTSTVNVTSTNSVSGTASSSGLVHPEFFEGQSSGKEYRASYDIGVKEGQVGIAFGYSIEWQGRVLGYPTDKCGLVILLPGWYERFSLTDGRYEVYDLPESNRDFWIRDLARQRMEEQESHYGCSGKSDVQVWKSGVPAVVWSIVAPPTTTTTVTVKTSSSATVTPTAKSVTPVPTVVPTATSVACEPQRTGAESLRFQKGDEVWGCTIKLDSGQECKPTDDGQCNCYLASAPGPGTVTTGVICPAPGEVPENIRKNPWTP